MKFGKYEICFLLDPNEAATNFDGITDELKTLLKEFKGENIEMEKWDDRKLAYPINGQQRGVYVLCFADLPKDNITKLRHELKLKKEVLRNLILAVNKNSSLSQAMNEKDW